MSLLVATVLGALAIVLAAPAHELTHVAAAAPFARSTRVDWRRLDAYAELDAETSRLVDRWIGLAPVIVGLTVGLIALAVGAAPPLSLENSLLFVAWGVYTIGGDVSDYRPSYGEAEKTARSKPFEGYYKFFFGFLAMPAAWSVAQLNGYAGFGLMVVAIGVTSMGLLEAEE
ncbi:hypothetical protein [Halomarina rubra]|uniref:DUF3267 domain-containing protein n=1 Tax=Halomarina rubra TaxID=2071873 RepID=A0ABD6B0M1_9EURY|nr:hypothetical protein [Halomarina rubra]